MKRLLVLFAVLVPLSLFIAGCGGAGGSSGTKSGTKSRERLATEATEEQKMQQRMKAGKIMTGRTPGEGAKK